MLGLQPLAVKLLVARICVRDGSPKGREGRSYPALGPLGGGMPKARGAKTYLYVFMSEPKDSVPRQPAPAQRGNAQNKCFLETWNIAFNARKGFLLLFCSLWGIKPNSLPHSKSTSFGLMFGASNFIRCSGGNTLCSARGTLLGHVFEKNDFGY